MKIAGPPAPESLRPDQLERRHRIVLAALRALARNGYDDVKISDIARDSNVALGTLYRYFASKDHLFAAAYVEWQSALKTKLENFVPEGATEAERLSEVFRMAIHAFEVQPQFFRVNMMLHDTTDPYAASIYQSSGPIFKETIELAIGHPMDSDHESILNTITAMLDHSLRLWVGNRILISDVNNRVNESIRLIYEFQPASQLS